MQWFQLDIVQVQRSAHRDLAVSWHLTSMACGSAWQYPQLAIHHYAVKALHSWTLSQYHLPSSDLRCLGLQVSVLPPQATI